MWLWIKKSNCGAVELLHYGVVELWICGVLGVWSCGNVDVWNCILIELRNYGLVGSLMCGLLERWAYGCDYLLCAHGVIVWLYGIRCAFMNLLASLRSRGTAFGLMECIVA